MEELKYVAKIINQYIFFWCYFWYSEQMYKDKADSYP